MDEARLLTFLNVLSSSHELKSSGLIQEKFWLFEQTISCNAWHVKIGFVNAKIWKGFQPGTLV